jgi:putative phage-type endonuclease
MNLAEIQGLEIKGTTIQCSPEWFAARASKISGSGMYSCVPHMTERGEIGKVRYDKRKIYINEKIHEHLSGKCYEIETNKRMEHGVIYEPEARAAYCKKFGNTVTEVGALAFPTVKRLCVSPDGIITGGADIDPDDLPILEIKCPAGTTHIANMKRGTCPPAYYGQVQSQIMVAGSSYGHFVSYDPLLPEEYRLFVAHVDRDDEYIRIMMKNIHLTLKAIDDGIEMIDKNLGLKVCPF